MPEDDQASKRREEELTATDLTDTPKPRSTWNATGEMSRGGTTAPDTSRPRDRSGGEDADVVTGFTQTSVSGSQGGRATFGLEPESERDFEKKLKEHEKEEER